MREVQQLKVYFTFHVTVQHFFTHQCIHSRMNPLSNSKTELGKESDANRLGRVTKLLESKNKTLFIELSSNGFFPSLAHQFSLCQHLKEPNWTARMVQERLVDWMKNNLDVVLCWGTFTAYVCALNRLVLTPTECFLAEVSWLYCATVHDGS